MVDEPIFSLPGIMVVFEDDSKPSNVTFFLSPHDGLEPDGFPLSGLPKVLSNECKARPNLHRSRKNSSVKVRSSPTSTFLAGNRLAQPVSLVPGAFLSIQSQAANIRGYPVLALLLPSSR